MNRREFVKQASLAVATIGSAGGAAAVPGDAHRSREVRKGIEPYKTSRNNNMSK